MGEKQKGGKGSRGEPRTGQELLRRLESEGRGRVQVSRNSVKIADALWVVAKPVLGKAKAQWQVEQGLRTAVLAWNLSLLPEDKRKEMLDQSMQPVKWYFRWFIRRMIRTLLARKAELYPKEHQMIADVQVSGEAPTWKVKVATVVNAPQQQRPGWR